MAAFVLKIYRRTLPKETRGLLEDRVELEATEEMAARNESRQKFDGLNWDTHFAALEGDGGKMVTFWASKYA